MKDVQDLYIKKAKHGEGNGKPLQYSCLGNPKDRGAWWDRVTQRIRLTKEMASHSSILAREIPRTEEPGGIGSHKESD